MDTKEKISLAALVIAILTFLFGSGILKINLSSSETGSTVATSVKPVNNVSAADNQNAPPKRGRSVRVGDSLYFGSYEQDNNLSNGQESIEWIVLDKKGNSLLLISRYCLDCRPFHSVSYEKVTWENCSLRYWLNNAFFNKAFTEIEKQKVLSTELSNNAGGNTKDKVFLLSINEAENYFASNEDRVSIPTVYAFYQGCFSYNLASNTNHQCENSPYYESSWSSSYDPKAGAWWWFRSSGSDSSKAAGVRTVGNFNKNGNDIGTGNDAVRPAVWVIWDE